MTLGHGEGLGLAIELLIVVLGLAALGAAIFVGARRKVDEYDATRDDAEEEPERADRRAG